MENSNPVPKNRCSRLATIITGVRQHQPDDAAVRPSSVTPAASQTRSSTSYHLPPSSPLNHWVVNHAGSVNCADCIPGQFSVDPGDSVLKLCSISRWPDMSTARAGGAPPLSSRATEMAAAAAVAVSCSLLLAARTVTARRPVRKPGRGWEWAGGRGPQSRIPRPQGW